MEKKKRERFELVFKRIFYKAIDIGNIRTTREIVLSPFYLEVEAVCKGEAEQIGGAMVNSVVAFNERIVELLEVRQK